MKHSIKCVYCATCQQSEWCKNSGCVHCADVPKTRMVQIGKQTRVKCVETGAVFASPVNVAGIIGVLTSAVERAIDMRTACHGLHFELTSEPYNLTPYLIEKTKESVVLPRGTKARSVRCVTTGDVYRSITEAAKATNCNAKSVRLVCLGVQPLTQGLAFEWGGVW